LISQLYVQDDKFIETDVQFGVTRHLIGNYVRHENEKAPAADIKGPWYSLEHTFVMEAGQPKLPRPPITGKASGERTKIPHLACRGVVIAGLDPAIHHSSQKVFEGDGCAGRARA